MTRVPPTVVRTGRFLEAAVPRHLRLALLVASLAACSGKTAQDYLEAAKADLAKNDRPAAIIQLKNALQEQPSLAEARFLLGKALLAGGDPRAAEIELGKARELGIAAEDVVPDLARSLLAQGEADKLLSTYGSTKLNTPVSASDLQTSVAVAYNMIGKPDKAIEQLNAAIATDPENMKARLVHVRMRAASGDLKQAQTEFQAVEAKWPQASDVFLLKGDLLSGERKFDEAGVAYRRAAELDHGNVAAQAGVLSVLLVDKDAAGAKKQLEVLRAAKASAYQVQYFSTLIALEQNDLDAARDSAQALLKLAPSDSRALHVAGVTDFKRGALLEAESDLSKAIQAAPDLANARVLLAQTNLRLGNPARALSVLQALLDDRSANADALSSAAEAYLQQGDLKRAEELFARASKIQPTDPRNRSALAMAQIDRGRVAEGLAALRSLAASDPSPVGDLALVMAFMQRKDWDQALKAVDALEAKQPGKVTAPDLRGRIEAARGNPDKARAAFEAALRADPAYFPAVAGLADLDLAAHQPDAAIKRIQKVLERQPKNVQANMALINARAQAGASLQELAAALDQMIKLMPAELQPRLALVELQIKAQNVKAALAAAQDATVIAPNSTEAWRFLAQAQAVAGEGNQAINSFNKLIALQPSAPEPYLQLAQFYSVRGDSTNALSTIRRAIDAKPDYLPARQALAAAELQAGHAAQAHQIANDITTQYPTKAAGPLLNGDIYANQKQWPAAAEAYRNALRVEPRPEIAIKLHQLLVVQGGKAGDPKEFASQWMAKYPKDLAFVYHMGDAALLQGNYPQALQNYQDVLKAQPDNAAAMNNIAWLLWKTNKPGALDYAERANRLVPDQPAFMDTLVSVLEQSGQVQKAVELQKRVLGLNPDQPSQRLHLARLYIEAGQKSAARDELNRLASLGDRFSEQAEVKSLLAKL